MKENETHNYRYDQLQTEYLKTRDKKILGEMYLVCCECITNYIHNYERKHNFKFPPDDFEDRVQDGAIYVIGKYLIYQDFKIEKLSAYAYFGFLKSCFNEKLKEIGQFETSYEQWAENELAKEMEFDS